jgi:class 3 adenylate cyclase
MRQALSRHNELVRGVVEGCGGYVFKTMGDSFCVAFSEPISGVSAAVRIQQTLEREEWDDVEPLRVRMALHAGADEITAESPHRCAS